MGDGRCTQDIRSLAGWTILTGSKPEIFLFNLAIHGRTTKGKHIVACEGIPSDFNFRVFELQQPGYTNGSFLWKQEKGNGNQSILVEPTGRVLLGRWYTWNTGARPGIDSSPQY